MRAAHLRVSLEKDDVLEWCGRAAAHERVGLTTDAARRQHKRLRLRGASAGACRTRGGHAYNYAFAAKFENGRGRPRLSISCMRARAHAHMAAYPSIVVHFIRHVTVVAAWLTAICTYVIPHDHVQ